MDMGGNKLAIRRGEGMGNKGEGWVKGQMP